MKIGDMVYIPNSQFPLVHRATITDIDVEGHLMIRYDFLAMSVPVPHGVKVYSSLQDAQRALFKNLLKGEQL